MRYECDCCGACCRQLIVEIDDEDLMRESRLRPLLITKYYGGGGLLACGPKKPCGALTSDSLCSVYRTRPEVCLTAPAGGPSCQLARELDGLPKLGPTFPLPLVS